MVVKGKIQQDDLWIINVYAPNTRAATFVKETLLKLKTHWPSHIVVGGFSTPLSPMDRSSRQKLNSNTRTNRHYKPNINQIAIDHFTKRQKNIPSFQHSGTFSKIDHIFSYKASLNSYKKIEITPCILSNHHGLKLDFNKNRNNRKPTKSWKLNSSLLNDH